MGSLRHKVLTGPAAESRQGHVHRPYPAASLENHALALQASALLPWPPSHLTSQGITKEGRGVNLSGTDGFLGTGNLAFSGTGAPNHLGIRDPAIWDKAPRLLADTSPGFRNFRNYFHLPG